MGRAWSDYLGRVKNNGECFFASFAAVLRELRGYKLFLDTLNAFKNRSL
jgi:hypothetical protein